MNKWLLYFFFLFACTEVLAQSVEGFVVDNHQKPLEVVSVVLFDKSSKKPVAFTRTDANGNFTLPYQSGKEGTLFFTLLGYAKDSIDVQYFKSGQTIVLKEKPFLIKSVEIKAPRISQRGDTLTYPVNVFKQGQDRSIADVIAKMPGLQVNNDGTIEYQGRRINKFYIEGMDMLGSKYAQVSENLSADKVKSVQVYENHQQVKMLRGLSFSEQAALNIVLKDDAKNVWQGVIDIGAGSGLTKDADFLCDSRFNSMFFSRKMQTFSMYKFNNSGAVLKEAINLRKVFGMGVPEASNFVENISLNVPDLNSARTRMNQTHLLSSNWLFKTGKDSDLRFQLSGVWDENKVEENIVTEYTDIASNNRIAEYSNASSHNNYVSGELLYRVNSDRLFLTNNLNTNLFFDKGTGMSLVNEQKQNQYVKPHRRIVSDELNMVNKLRNGKHLKSDVYLSYNYLPSKLLTAKGNLQELNLSQFFWGATTSFSHPLGKINAQYGLGNEGFTQLIDEESQRLALNYLQLVTKASIGFFDQGERYSWNIILPVALLSQTLDGHNHLRVEIEPKATLTYKPNQHWDITSAYSYSEQPSDGLALCTTPLFISHLSQRVGNGSYDYMKMHLASLNVAYKNVLHGLFASLRLGYTNRPDGTLYRHELDGIIYRSFATAYKRSSNTFYTTGRFTKDFGSKLSVSLTCYFSQSNSYNLVGDIPVAFRFKNINGSVSLGYKPCSWLAIEEKSFIFHSENERNQSENADEYSEHTNTFNHEFNVFVTPKKWVIAWKNELYHSNDRSASFNFFSDLSVGYKFKDSEISLSLNNLMNNSTYERKIIHSDFIVNTIHQLRPREFIIKYSFAL